MKRCWTYESEKRPNFEEILDELQTLFTGNIDGDEYYYSQNGLYDNRKWRTFSSVAFTAHAALIAVLDNRYISSVSIYNFVLYK